MIYLQLFWSFFQIGLFSFGGGMAAMPMIQNQIVSIRGWLTLTEFTDLVTISEMTPGPIAINAATFVGTLIGGPGGAVISTLGCILPSSAIALLLAWLYSKYSEMTLMQGVLAGLRPAVVALILSAGLNILTLSLWGEAGFSWNIRAIDAVAALLFASGLFLLRKFKAGPLLIMASCGLIGGVIYLTM